MDRRAFLETGGYAALAAGLGHAACTPARAMSRLDRIGVQLYTVRGEMAKNVEGTLDRVAEIGYQEVEFVGYFDRSPEQIRDALLASGLDAPAAHIPLESLDDGWERQLEVAEIAGHRYLVVAWIPPAQRKGVDAYKRFAGLFNRAGEQARTQGITFAFPLNGGDVGFELGDSAFQRKYLLSVVMELPVKLIGIKPILIDHAEDSFAGPSLCLHLFLGFLDTARQLFQPFFLPSSIEQG